MINNLSTELILEILVYLDYGNIENLSWTQKRYMMIVQRHFPEALEQKIWIRKISIVPSENNSSVSWIVNVSRITFAKQILIWYYRPTMLYCSSE